MFGGVGNERSMKNKETALDIRNVRKIRQSHKWVKRKREVLRGKH